MTLAVIACGCSLRKSFKLSFDDPDKTTVVPIRIRVSLVAVAFQGSGRILPAVIEFLQFTFNRFL